MSLSIQYMAGSPMPAGERACYQKSELWQTYLFFAQIMPSHGGSIAPGRADKVISKAPGMAETVKLHDNKTARHFEEICRCEKCFRLQFRRA
jgi:hypothetical protein